MRLYMIKIIGRPAESLASIDIAEDGTRVGRGLSGWKPEGWDAFTAAMALEGHRWAEESPGFFWPSETKRYFSRSSAADKVAIVKRWGGEAILLEAEVGEFIPTDSANAIRKEKRDQKRVEALKAKILAIDPFALERVA